MLATFLRTANLVSDPLAISHSRGCIPQCHNELRISFRTSSGEVGKYDYMTPYGLECQCSVATSGKLHGVQLCQSGLLLSQSVFFSLFCPSA